MSNMRQLNMATGMYVVDYDGKLPVAGGWNIWDRQLAPYYSKQTNWSTHPWIPADVLRCPSDDIPRDDLGSPGTDESTLVRSYFGSVIATSFNGYSEPARSIHRARGVLWRADVGAGVPDYPTPTTIEGIRNLSALTYLGEFFHNRNIQFRPEQAIKTYVVGDNWLSTPANQVAYPMTHGEGNSIAFLDGHVANHRPWEPSIDPNASVTVARLE